MDSERELLELAAKAVGRRLWIDTNGRFWGNSEPWNPLTDDGDALRLAVRLGLKVWCAKTLDLCQASTPGGEVWAGGEKCPDPYAATRLAIVRAAAAIGRADASQ